MDFNLKFDCSDNDLRSVLLYLQWVLYNLDDIQDAENPSSTIYSDGLDEIDTDLCFVPELGLCDNILSIYLYQREIDDLFESWGGSDVSLLYPCDDRADFVNEDSVNLYLNPKRISLIEHIIACINTELELRYG